MFALIWTNLTRRKGRLVLTLASVLVAFLLFGVLMAVRQGFTGTPPQTAAAARRLTTINKVAPLAPMPIAYAKRIADVPGVKAVTYFATLIGHYQSQSGQIVALAAPDDFLAVFPDSTLPPSQRKAWRAERDGVLITASLAKRFGWSVGDHIPIQSDLRQIDGKTTWDITIDGILRPPSGKGASQQRMFMHYEYLNQSRASGKNTAVSFVELVADSDQAGEVSERIDRSFANATPRTRTAPRNEVFRQLYGSFGDVGAIMVDVTAAVFFSMLLIIGAILLHSARERLSEFAVMRALGFRNTALTGVVLGESILICLIGGIAGIGAAYLLVGKLQVVMGALLPGIAVTAATELIAFGLMILLGLLAGTLPAMRTARLSVRDALEKA